MGMWNCENSQATQKEKRNVQELTYINSSLSILGQCISALSEPNRNHIPFRSSKLTRILKDSLEYGSSIIIFICISPSIDSFSETNSTLKVNKIIHYFSLQIEPRKQF